ncbi:MAG: hypothetical protein HY335_09730 [Deinococcus sp.]|nr:hypothetical protein [Deinococcus sp.]
MRPHLWERMVPAACGISAVLTRRGQISGEMIVSASSCLRNRGNGLGGGFAAYGLYPDRANFFALHILSIHSAQAADKVRHLLDEYFEVSDMERVPTYGDYIPEPGLWRFFVQVPPRQVKAYASVSGDLTLGERDYVAKVVDQVNRSNLGTFVASSGKNFAVFKGIGRACEVAQHYGLNNYMANYWIHHDRFPTNSKGEARASHPHVEDGWEFAVVHNGEISSYGANRITLEMHDYSFPIATDSLVIAKALTFFHRRGIPFEEASRMVLCAPTWEEIDRLPKEQAERYREARIRYGSLILDGPFSIVVGFTDGIFGLRDRKGLRPLVWGTKGDLCFFGSEEAAIQAMADDVTTVQELAPGEPVFFRREQV